MADPLDALYAPLPGQPRIQPTLWGQPGAAYDRFANLVQGNYGPMRGMSPFGLLAQGMFPTGDQARGRFNALTMGFGDELLAAGRSALGGEPYGDALNDERYRLRRLMDRDPKAGIVEMIYGTAPWFAAPASLAGHAAPLLARGAGYTGMGALQGGISGFGEGEKDFNHRLGHAAKGALLGGALMGLPWVGYHAAKAFPTATKALTGGALGTLAPSEAQGAEPPPGFFSVLERAIAGSKNKAMPAEQWSAFLTPGRREVRVGDLNFPLRDEELKWSGLPGYLEDNVGKRITVDELLRQIEGRPLPEFKQPPGEYRPINMEDQPEELQGLFSNLADRASNHAPEGHELFDQRFEELLDIFHTTPRGRRVQEGMDWAREHGVELGDAERRLLFDRQYAGPGNQYQQHILPGPTTGYGEELTKFRAPRQPYPRASEAELAGLTDEQRSILEGARANLPESPPAYTSSHFGSEGQDLLSHSRWSRRQTDAGEPVHVVEEVQSDWHQQGREQGYKGQDPLSEMSPEDRALVEKYRDDNYNEIPPDVRERYHVAARQYEDLLDKKKLQVPAAPFSKTYHELELKKNLARAVANGDDYLALTTGTQQADRWNQLLHKNLTSIDWRYVPVTEKYSLTPMKDGRSASGGPAIGVSKDELRDYIGKEMADKILSDPAASGTLTGDNLSIGGAGMRHTYDEVYRGYLEKLAKQFGGEVTMVRVPGRSYDEAGYWRWLQDTGRQERMRGLSLSEERAAHARYRQEYTKEGGQHEVPALRITDKMRKNVQKSGLPLFSAPAATGAAGLTGYLGLRAPEEDFH